MGERKMDRARPARVSEAEGNTRAGKRGEQGENVTRRRREPRGSRTVERRRFGNGFYGFRCDRLETPLHTTLLADVDASPRVDSTRLVYVFRK